MIKVHYQLGGDPFGEEQVKNKTFTTKDPGAGVEFLETGWVVVHDADYRHVFAIQAHKVQYIEGKNDVATEG